MLKDNKINRDNVLRYPSLVRNLEVILTKTVYMYLHKLLPELISAKFSR
jgi:hypothetical protein